MKLWHGRISITAGGKTREFTQSRQHLLKGKGSYCLEKVVEQDLSQTVVEEVEASWWVSLGKALLQLEGRHSRRLGVSLLMGCC